MVFLGIYFFYGWKKEFNFITKVLADRLLLNAHGQALNERLNNWNLFNFFIIFVAFFTCPAAAA